MTHSEQMERRKQIAAAVAEGGGCGDVGRQFGVCQATVYLACREHGVGWASGASWNARRHPFEVLVLLRAPEYVSDSQVARDCGLTHQRVGQIKAKARSLGLL